MKILPVLLLAASTLSCLRAHEPYSIETIPFPEGVPPEVGAIGFTPSGDLAVALRRSDLIIATPQKDPAKFEWRLFASGLHNACGMHIVSDHEIIVSQMAELTRLVDTNKDGRADLYESLASPWGMSGNYHETNHLVPDGKGGHFVAIGTASHNGPVFYNVKGDYSKVGRRGRNFSAATWKGWILHIDREGKTTPWASGFRMHNGILLDSKNRLWAGDNQGDWKAATPFYHVERGNFYGHVSSLVWDPEWNPAIDPLDLPLEEINRMKTPAAVLLPHAEMNRSASEPVEIPEGTVFGPYGGQIILPDNNGERLSRLMLEEVDGVYQGACTHFFQDNGLRPGNNRAVFSPDKTTLYIGQTSRGWGQIAEGLQRIRYTGTAPFDVKTMTLTPSGFRLTFTKKAAKGAESPENFQFSRHRYEDTGNYGGDKLDESGIKILDVRRVDDRTIEIDLEDLDDGGWVYGMKLDGFRFADDQPLRTCLFYYTVNRLKK